MNSIEEIPEDYMITKRNLNPLARLKKIFFPNNTFTGTDAKIETFKTVLDFYKSLHLKIKPKKWRVSKYRSPIIGVKQSFKD